MIPHARLGRTELRVSRIGLGTSAFGAVNRAQGWDPFSGEGRALAIRTVRAALEAGINYFDTAPACGAGQGESILGEALAGQRNQVVLASKVGYRGLSPGDVRRSLEESLKRLRTDYLDVLQFHGGMFKQEELRHILEGGLLDQLEALKEQGKVRFLGFATEEPWTARPLIASFRFDLMQVRYNLIHQGAALHALDEARQTDLGVVAMRPMTSGIFQQLCRHLAPGWQEQHDLYEVALKFVLSDSRVHVASIGMRWPEEVARNVALAASFVPDLDLAHFPRLTADVYRMEDESAGEPNKPSGA